MLECLAVGAGGFIGAVCRYLVGLLPVREEWNFPISSFLINILGCFIIGLIAASVEKYHTPGPRMVLFLKAGICGGFTTFSSFALETSDLIKSGNLWTGFFYALLSVALGLCCVFAAELLIDHLA